MWELLVCSLVAYFGTRHFLRYLQRVSAPYESLQPPPDSGPNIVRGAACGLSLSLLAAVLLGVSFSALMGLLIAGPILGAMVQNALEHAPRLAVAHPWRIEAQQLAAQAGRALTDVRLVQRADTAPEYASGRLYLPTMLLREFPPEERRFLIARSLYAPGRDASLALGGDWPEDRFALLLTGDIRGAVRALERLAHLYPTSADHAAPLRIEKLRRWHAQRQASAGGAAMQVVTRP